MAKQRRMRIIARSHSKGWGKTQFLQEKRWWGWKTIDEEEVPSHVMISIGSWGGDTSGWRSKFWKYGTFGKDGIIHPHTS